MLEVVIALSLAVLVGSAIAHKTRITPAIVLIFIGLPIMLFWEARNTSWREARTRIRGIILTGSCWSS